MTHEGIAASIGLFSRQLSKAGGSVTSVYTELTKEAAKRGGPAALRSFYRNLGRGQGAVVGAAALGTGVFLYNKVSARRTSSSAVQTPDTEGKDGSVPGEGDDV